MSRKILVAALLGLALVALIIVRALGRDTGTPQAVSGPGAPVGVLEVVATGLDVPWDVAFLPDGDLLVTERSGTLQRIGPSSASYHVEGVVERGEGGLHGVAVHPDFESNAYVYLYFTSEQAGQTVNRIARYTLSAEGLVFDRAIVDGIPGGSNHNGGRIAFGPDGMLYATTGEGGVEERAQDRESLAGKVLRVRDDGAVPEDNPFGTPVWSYGHRNPQGIAWDGAGRLWETEHGRSGARSGYDEVNLIEKGANYGWPVIQGDEERAGMRAPALHSGPSTTWAPAGLAFHGDRLFFAGLRGEALYEVPVAADGTLGALAARFGGELGRLRAAAAHDGGLYFSTSNRDGRGKARAGDDRLLRLTL